MSWANCGESDKPNKSFVARDHTSQLYQYLGFYITEKTRSRSTENDDRRNDIRLRAHRLNSKPNGKNTHI